MAVSLGRSARILCATTVTPTTPVEDHFDGRLKWKKDRVDRRTNDSAGWHQHVIAWNGGEFTFSMLRDEAATVQNVVRNSGMEADATLYFIVQPRGNVGGAKQYAFQGTIDIEKGTPRDGLATDSVTVTVTGSIVATTI